MGASYNRTVQRASGVDYSSDYIPVDIHRRIDRKRSVNSNFRTTPINSKRTEYVYTESGGRRSVRNNIQRSVHLDDVHD